ncbi:MAG: hypothetical protein AB9869_36860 [Verrucomicrobiia bacterium]
MDSARKASSCCSASGQFVLAGGGVTNAFELHAVAGAECDGGVTALNQEGLAGTVIELIRAGS